MKAYCNGRTDNLIAYKGNRNPISLYVGNDIIDNLSPEVSNGESSFVTEYNNALISTTVLGKSEQEIRRSNNLFDISQFNTQTSGDVKITEVSQNYIKIETVRATTSGFCNSGITLRELCPFLEVGKKYTLTAQVDISNGTPQQPYSPYRIYLTIYDNMWYFADNPRGYSGTNTITEDMLNSFVCFYGSTTPGYYIYSNFQMVEGEYTETTMPPYEPFGTSPTPILPSPIVSVKNFTITQTNGQNNADVSINTTLREIDELRDILTIDFLRKNAKIHRQIANYVFTGQENVVYNSSGLEYYIVDLINAPIAGLYQNTMLALCSDFLAFVSLDTPPGNNEFEIFQSNGVVKFQPYNVTLPHGYSGTTDSEKEQAFKQWLSDRYASGNPVTLQYVLYSSYDENITLLNSDYEAFKNTYGTNNLNVTSDGIENGIEIYTQYYKLGGRNGN